jgi:hypothetical protein
MKRKIFLLAVMLPCIIAAIFMGISFRTEKAPILTAQSTDDDPIIIQQEQDASALAYQTMLNDGGPFEEDVNTSKQFYHYCTYTEHFELRSDRLAWVQSMMGPGNSNHVHYITFDLEMRMYPPEYRATVKIWTSSPCSTFGDPVN